MQPASPYGMERAGLQGCLTEGDESVTMRDEAREMVFLIAVDGSAHADAALRWVAGLGPTGIALRCVLLNVQKPIMSSEVGAISPADYVIAERERSAAEILEQAAGILRGAGVRYVVKAIILRGDQGVVTQTRPNPPDILPWPAAQRQDARSEARSGGTSLCSRSVRWHG